MNIKTYLVSLHRKYKKLQYNCIKAADFSTEPARTKEYLARASVYSMVADDILDAIDNADDSYHDIGHEPTVFTMGGTQNE